MQRTPGFVERGGAAAVPFEDPLWNFKGGGGAGGVRPLWPSLKTLFGISKGGGAGGVRPLWPSLKTLFGISKGGGAPCAPPPESASELSGNRTRVETTSHKVGANT